MKNKLKENVITPLTMRIGTMAAGAILGTIHADASLIQELGTALAAVLLVGFDLVISRFQNKRS